MRVQRVMTVLIMVAATVLVLPSGAAAEVSDFCAGQSGPVLVCDDFSAADPLAAYRFENPRPGAGHAPMQISIVDEALAFEHVSGFGVAAAFRTDGVQLRDTTFEADVTLSSASSAIAGIEWESDLDNRFQFWIGLNQARIDLRDSGSWTTSQGVGFSIVPGRTYRLSLDVFGNSRAVAAIDGTTMLDITYDLSFMPETSFPGFLVNSYGPSGTFDDMTVVAHNVPPVSDPGGPYLGAVDTAIGFDGTGSSDPDGDALTFDWAWGDTTGSLDAGATPTHTYAATGVYDVCLTVADPDAAADTACTYTVVYDPDGGFVTGGGWIDSPEGAYLADPSLTGRANFGFVSKYKKGTQVPTGTTEFQFQVAGLNFHSTSYDWLVVTGSDVAKFKGVGTINGTGEYTFQVWAGDDDPDTFRIKISTEDQSGAETVVYDNGMHQPIGGGNIVVHAKRK